MGRARLCPPYERFQQIGTGCSQFWCLTHGVQSTDMYKEIADYGVGHGAVVTTAEADDAISDAARLIDCITTLLAEGRP